MSGESERRTSNRCEFPRTSAPVRFLLKWTLWTTFFLASGCVVPLAPDFQDPPSVPNYPPYFFNSDPPAAKVMSPPQVFTVTVVDPNPQDVLYVRWLSDYPPYTQFVTALVQSNDGMSGMSQDPQLGGVKLLYDTGGAPGSPKKTPCNDFVTHGPANHTLALVVSDRPFLPPDQAPNPDYRYNAIAAGNSDVAIMEVWTVSCP